MMKDFDILKVLGKGSYGKVYKARRKSDGFICVIKKVPLEGLNNEERQVSFNESKVMSKIQHFNIIQYYDSVIENNYLIIVMEYAEGGDLSHKLKSNPQHFEEENLWSYLIQGLKYLHDNRILHRDIKAQNIFLDVADNIKIGDFGLGKKLNAQSQFAYTNVGTPLYLSPEIVEELPYNDKSDVWACGCLFYELAAKRPPFTATNQVTLAKKIVSDKPSPLPNHYSADFQFLVFKMLEKDVTKRPDIGAILNYSPVKIRMERSKFKLKEKAMQEQYNQLEERIKGELSTLQTKWEEQKNQLESIQTSHAKELGAVQRRAGELEVRCNELEELLAEKEEVIQKLKNELNAKPSQNPSPSWKRTPLSEHETEEYRNLVYEEPVEIELPSTSVTVDSTPMNNKTASISSPNDTPASQSSPNKAKRKKSISTPSISFMNLEENEIPSSPAKPTPINYRPLFADELGICSYSKAHSIQPFSSLYVWKRILGNVESPPNRNNEKFPTNFAKVWRERERCRLYNKTKHFILVYKLNSSLKFVPSLKSFMARFQMEPETAFTKIALKNVMELDISPFSEFPGQRFCFEVSPSMTGNREVLDFLLELDTPNALDEVVVLRYDRRFLQLAETPAELREIPSEVFTPIKYRPFNFPKEGIVQKLNYDDQNINERESPTKFASVDFKTMQSIEKIQEKIRTSQEILKKVSPSESNYYSEKLELLKSNTPRKIFIEKDISNPLMQGNKENLENVFK